MKPWTVRKAKARLEAMLLEAVEGPQAQGNGQCGVASGLGSRLTFPP